MQRVFCVFITLLSTAVAGPASNLEHADQATFGLLVDGSLTGSGFIVDPSGYALTAAHQISAAQPNLHAQSNFLGRVRLDVVALDRGRDIALLRTRNRKTRYPFIPLATQRLSIAGSVHLLATPNYRHNLVLSGRVARVRIGFEYFKALGHYVAVQYISAHAPAGTSGGPWLNPAGQAVGMQVGLMHTGQGAKPAPAGVAYMVPANDLKAVLDSRESIERPSMRIGVEEFWEQDADYRQQFAAETTGLIVARISKSSRAYRSGLRRGHVIHAVDGRRVSHRDDFLNFIGQKQVADRVELTLIGKNGQNRTISVVLEGI
ncbi:MAG: S1C family serine protease [Myxococcota bacterium]|nr:S1C family serine protease [Myxococcota bacterium]